jgi:hypothetical protein
MAMSTDFQRLWLDPATANRDRKRMLAHIIEDATLIKVPAEGLTKIHVRFKGGKTETLSAVNPKSSAQQITTPPEIVALVDRLLDDHVYSEIAEILNERGLHPGGSARPGRQNVRFTPLRVAYVVHSYGLRSRYDRLRARGMLTTKELAKHLGIHEATVVQWAKNGILVKHAYNGHFYLYEDPGPDPPTKHSSRWHRLVDRAAHIQARNSQLASLEAKEV